MGEYVYDTNAYKGDFGTTHMSGRAVRIHPVFEIMVDQSQLLEASPVEPTATPETDGGEI